ncbi:Asp-tRNA(Asn)/Glu-tRNA(Gln) amidotransferase subunit GatC [Patescibacteria group bacterium]|nr:Asp-tRNA(Asn)/Glu-tRNA(Gln) amidotransferase subunit GatC [Patescibacteria group bacterium]MBU1727795.1 Asp-tRNA(Asn)/Glu-tRNA(Gln) amidotransferase subunit GatC [Patescibacteria group bacterium]
MKIEDVEKLAELAKIELTNEEKEKLLSDMEGILGYVKQIQSVDITDTEPEYLNKNRWREDELEPREFSRKEITSQFPDSKDGFVKVKKIL